MLRESDLYCPTLLGPQVDVGKADLFRAGAYPYYQEHLESLDDQYSVRVSLEQFKPIANAGLLDRIAQDYCRNEASKRSSGRFVMSSPLSRQGFQYVGSRRFGSEFFTDGDIGFALGFQRPLGLEPLWFAVTSFSAGNRLKAYNKGLHHESNNIPIILQLQGASASYTYNRLGPYKQAISLMQDYLWERMLVSIVTHWAKSAGLPAVYMLPAAMSKYRLGTQDRHERLTKRHDFTAQRCGFVQGEDGFWVFSLAQPNGIMHTNGNSPPPSRVATST